MASPSPMHTSTGQRDGFHTLMHTTTGQRDSFPTPLCTSTGHMDGFPTPLRASKGWRDGFPTPVQGGRTDSEGRSEGGAREEGRKVEGVKKATTHGGVPSRQVDYHLVQPVQCHVFCTTCLQVEVSSGGNAWTGGGLCGLERSSGLPSAKLVAVCSAAVRLCPAWMAAVRLPALDSPHALTPMLGTANRSLGSGLP